MTAARNIQAFLEAFRTDDPVHRRVFRMLAASPTTTSELRALIALLLQQNTNASNLSSLLPLLSDVAEDAVAAPSKDSFVPVKDSAFSATRLPANENSKKADSKDSQNILSESNEPLPGQSACEAATSPAKPLQTDSLNENENLDLKDSLNPSKRLKIDKSVEKPVAASRRRSQVSKSSAAVPACLALPRQCPLCGLRFAALASSDSADPLQEHSEGHRRHAQAAQALAVRHREFFSSAAKKAPRLDLELEDYAEALPWTGDAPVCIICGNLIEKEWDTGMDAWVLRSGVQINESEVAHRDCVL